MTTTRRTVLARATASIAAGVAAPAILAWPAGAAEFAHKYGTALPDGHPMVIRSAEAVAKIKEESGGRLDITLYPSSVLGQDTAMMSQAIAGALEVYGMSMDILAQKSPSAAIFGVGFAFSDYDVAWKAMDGDLGAYCRGLAEKTGLYCMDKAFDHGFREITMKSKPIDTPDDLKGVKIRLPVAPLFISLFQHLGASPTPAWKRLPADAQAIAYKNFSAAAIAERADWQVMDKTESDKLKAGGLTFNTPDTKPFQEALRKSGSTPT
jgi:TRAP-type transport system periplasmic protein